MVHRILVNLYKWFYNFWAKFNCHFIFLIQIKKGGLDFDLYDDDQGTLGTWLIDINHFDKKHDQL